MGGGGISADILIVTFWRLSALAEFCSVPHVSPNMLTKVTAAILVNKDFIIGVPSLSFTISQIILWLTVNPTKRHYHNPE